MTVTTEAVTIVLVVAGLVLALIFLAQLASVHWRATPAGKSTMLLSVVIVGVLGLATVRYLGITPPGWVRPAMWASIDLALAYRVTNFIRSSREGRRDRERRELMNR